MVSFLLKGLALGFAAAVQPGPFMVFLISQTLDRGFRKTWYSAFAPLLSDGPIIAITLLVLVQMPPWLSRSLNIAGGLFILFLAWKALGQWMNYSVPGTEDHTGGKISIFKAALMNTLSPMPYIYWSFVTGPILLSGWREAPAFGFSFLFAFYFAMIGTLICILAVFGSAKKMGDQVSRFLLGISVLALAIFGLMQLWFGVTG